MKNTWFVFALIATLTATFITSTESLQEKDVYTRCNTRIIQASPNVDGINLYFTTGSGNASTVVSFIENVEYTQEADYVELDAGTYNILIQEFSTNDTLMEIEYECVENAVKTITITGLKNETHGKYVLGYMELDDAVQQPLATYSTIRFFHAAPYTPPINVTLDNITLATQLPYQALSTRLTSTSGTYTVNVTIPGVNGTTVVSTTVKLDSELIYTLVLMGIYEAYPELAVIQYLDYNIQDDTSSFFSSDSSDDEKERDKLIVILTLSGFVVLVLFGASMMYMFYRKKRLQYRPL